MNNSMQPRDLQAGTNAQQLVSHQFPAYDVPQLDATAERLLYLAEKNGYLTGRNSVLEINNADLSRQIDNLKAQLVHVKKELEADRKQFMLAVDRLDEISEAKKTASKKR